MQENKTPSSEKKSIEIDCETNCDCVYDSSNIYEGVFDKSPVPTWIGDISEIEQVLLKIKKEEIVNLESYFSENPNFIKDTISKLKIINVNQATLKLYKAKTKAEFINDFDKLLSYVSYERLQSELISFMKGEECPYKISLARDLEGREFPIEVKWFRIEKSPFIIVSVIDISEKITAQQLAKLTNLRFKKLFDNIQVGMAILKITEDKKDFEITNINNFALKEENLKPSQVINKKFSKVFPSVLESKLLIQLLEVFKTGDSREFLAKFTKVINSKRETFYNKNFIFKLSDDEIGALYTDVTKEINLEIELGIREQKFKIAFNESSQLIAMVKIETGEIVEVNDTFVKIMGYKREEIIGKKTIDLNMWADNKRREMYVKEFRENGFLKDFELRFVTKSKEIRYGIMNVRKIQMNNEEYVLSMVNDVTEMKEREEKIEILSRAVKYGKISIVITDKDGNIEFVNPYFTEITGYSFEEVIGKNPKILSSGFQSKNYYKSMWEKILSGEEWSGEFQNRKKNGELYWEQATISPVFNSNNEITHFIALKGNITENKIIQKELFQAQKIEALGRLAGGVAHDFNNILTIINGYSDILKMSFKDDPKTYNFVNEIKNAGIRASSLTRQLLAFSRKETFKKSVVHLNELIENMEKMLNRLLGEDIKLEIICDECISSIEVDPAQIEQVLMNLVINARDAMPNGGEIKIVTKEVIFQDKDYVRLTVADSGTGIESENLKKIFEPFFTTKEAGKGTGLGLSMVFRIIKQHNALVDVESEVGKGTKFTIHIPISQKVIKDENSENELKEDNLGNGEHILLIEDDSIVLNTIKNFLEIMNFKISTATSLGEAKSIFEKDIKKFELIISDIVLPDGNGVELMQEFRELKPNLNMIVMSGYTYKSLRMEIIKELGFEYLQKPLSLLDLSKAIEKLIKDS